MTEPALLEVVKQLLTEGRRQEALEFVTFFERRLKGAKVLTDCGGRVSGLAGRSPPPP